MVTHQPWIVAVVLGAALAFVSCGGSAERRSPNVPAGTRVQELRRTAGDSAQDCGDAVESKGDTTCRVHPIGECLSAALKGCRPAYGMRSYFTPESDGVRIDWLVLQDRHGGCNLVVVEDRSADPLAPKTPTVKTCTSISWKAHESVPGCEAPIPDGCSAAKSTEPTEG